jgi:hypothetical protein
MKPPPKEKQNRGMYVCLLLGCLLDCYSFSFDARFSPRALTGLFVVRPGHCVYGQMAPELRELVKRKTKMVSESF